MKIYPTGVIVLDTLDIICISWSAGSALGYLIRRYIKRKNEDPIVTELKEKASIIVFSEDRKPLKLPLVRGGELIKGFSLVIRNKKLASLIRAIVNAKRKQRQLRALGMFFLTFNGLLTSNVGIRFAIGGSLDYIQFILITFPSTLGGCLTALVIANPLTSVLLPLAILYRGVEKIQDSSIVATGNCKAICKVAEKFHNQQLTLKMKELDSLVKDTSTALQLPLDKVPLICVEDKLSLLQRYKLKELIKSDEAKKRVQHFNEFLKKFPKCDVDPKEVYEQTVEKIAE